EIYPNHPLAVFSLARALTQSGKPDEAVNELRKAVQTGGPWPPMVSELGYALARAGKRDEARTMLNKLAALSHQRYVDPYLVASIQIGLGDKNAAFRELARAVEERSASLPWLKVEPKWDS